MWLTNECGCAIVLLWRGPTFCRPRRRRWFLYLDEHGNLLRGWQINQVAGWRLNRFVDDSRHYLFASLGHLHRWSIDDVVP
nr:hypothetical protein CFP56_04563 [Quercus suber]